ncbi:ectonucleoside triphosphate diphosphohydrolase 6 (putative) L homeolog [Xenopus laevis]|uniref:nucleoside diphosphate phosphatase n=1 Tax=Xenopus laevis TaxID=8355 RepID=Q2QDE4_XENLA|nr:ectonucleoside triphosphate diphosphohydrolase 6 (putative) L homeolog [Xenopus laevis]AAZ94876.1 ecto-nucleosidase triphosphate diphosphohydrolase 6 [Xenopus laevis]
MPYLSVAEEQAEWGTGANVPAHKRNRETSPSIMKIGKLPCVLLFVLCVMLFITYIKWNPRKEQAVDASDLQIKTTHELGGLSSKNEIFYGIMFDAGSTGTRIHIYQFSRTPSGAPNLDHEEFRALKPGLSSYADNPIKCAPGINELLNIAKKEIPQKLWASTPLVLKATAGLRLLPGEKAHKLLDMVRELFKASPFLIGKDSVSIMNGTDEGIFAWITVNFLTGSLNNAGKKHSGMLDLGGGSTQITFYPYSKNTLTSSPPGYMTKFELFGNTYSLYSHSYLGYGLMSARLAIMGGEEGKSLQEGEQLVTSCLTPEFVTEFKHAEITYKIKGQKNDEPLFVSCYKRVLALLGGKVEHSKEIPNLFFYAFSYYYDRAVDAHLIDAELGGSLKVKDFDMAAKKECKLIEEAPGENPFLCMDLTYITLLLQESGFPMEKELKLVKKIDNVETSWALGATFYYTSILNKQHS